jgi:hypothetical protein
VASSDTSTADGSPVPERRSLQRWVLALAHRDGVTDAAAGPEGREVVAAAVGVGSPRAVAVAASVDDPRVARADPVQVDAHAPPGAGQQVGDEHVGPLD